MRNYENDDNIIRCPAAVTFLLLWVLFHVNLHLVASQLKSHQPAVALHSGPFSHSQLPSSSVALGESGSTHSATICLSITCFGYCYSVQWCSVFPGEAVLPVPGFGIFAGSLRMQWIVGFITIELSPKTLQRLSVSHDSILSFLL